MRFCCDEILASHIKHARFLSFVYSLEIFDQFIELSWIVQAHARIRCLFHQVPLQIHFGIHALHLFVQQQGRLPEVGQVNWVFLVPSLCDAHNSLLSRTTQNLSLFHEMTRDFIFAEATKIPGNSRKWPSLLTTKPQRRLGLG